MSSKSEASKVPSQNATVFEPDHREIVAAALNEHGFLLQQLIHRKLQTRDPQDFQDRWGFEATEYPVTAQDGSQTRVDMLLRCNFCSGVYICMECKRPNPKYKRWVFFGTGSNVKRMPDWALSLETLTRPSGALVPGNYFQGLVQTANMEHVPLFNYYVEAAIDRNTKGQAASSTEAIEKAFYQVMKSHSGLMAKFRSFDSESYYRSIPVVVTTAQLYEAKFDPDLISVSDGMIDSNDLELAPLEYCAVNYRADDVLSIAKGIAHNKTEITVDLMRFQIRTIFVVQAVALNKFLRWAAQYLTNRE